MKEIKEVFITHILIYICVALVGFAFSIFAVVIGHVIAWELPNLDDLLFIWDLLKLFLGVSLIYTMALFFFEIIRK